MPPRRCVYTVLTGRYERLNEQPVAARSSIPFICFTDDPDLVSQSWQIRPLPPIFGMDTIRNQRECKLRPYRYLPEFDQSLYIDNSVLLSVPPDEVFDATDLSSGLCLPEHSFRDTVLDEFLAVIEANLDDPARTFEQLNQYGIEAPETLAAKPHWTAILLRDHGNPNLVAAMEIWLAHVQRYSRRDQLSSNLAFHRAGLTPAVLAIDNQQSWFHSWPHVPERNTNRRVWNGVADAGPLNARFRRMEQEVTALKGQIVHLEQHLAQSIGTAAARIAGFEQSLAEASSGRLQLERSAVDAAMQNFQLEARIAEQAVQHRAMLTSTTWRMMGPVRALGRAAPALARLGRRSLKLVWWTASLQLPHRVAAIRRRQN